MNYNFALIGAGGYIAPRHLKAIRATGNRLVAAADPHDSVGVLDQYDFEVRFFTEIERFDRHLEKLRRGAQANRVHYVSVCSPNYLHDAHCRLALRIGADVICEKPLVINPWNLDPLVELEQETGKRIYTVLQLRTHPSIMQLYNTLHTSSSSDRYDVQLTYVTSRGAWYHTSWKGSDEKSGGVAMNIGVHFFDMLLWLFGQAGESRVYYRDKDCACGFLDLERARVRWFLSVDARDLPYQPEPGRRSTFRSITVNGKEIDFTEGFMDLHTKVYEEILSGRGYGIADVRPSIELVHRIRHSNVVPWDDMVHPHFSAQAERGGADGRTRILRTASTY